MAVTRGELISQYNQIHSSKSYGVSGNTYYLSILACITDLKPEVVLEYGCGQSQLSEVLSDKVKSFVKYDPAIEEFKELSINQCDMLINTDVLEHIPESDLDDVLGHMKSLSSKVFFNICTRPALEILPDGTNAHCTVKSPEFWRDKIEEIFGFAQIAHVWEGQSCAVITWNSPVVELIDALEQAKFDARCRAQSRLDRLISLIKGFLKP